MAVFNTSAFTDSVDVVRPNLFTAALRINSKLSNYIDELSSGAGVTLRDGQKPEVNYDTPKQFSFRCEAAELPGRTIQGVDDDLSGPAFKIATDVIYNDITLSIIASKDMQERKLFEMWIDYMVSDSYSGASIDGVGGLSKYYNDYIGTLAIQQLDDDGNNLVEYVMLGAYPIGLSSMTANWDERDTYQRFTVTMAYRYHRTSFGQSTRITF